jgi:hypothetical protein
MSFLFHISSRHYLPLSRSLVKSHFSPSRTQACSQGLFNSSDLIEKNSERPQLIISPYLDAQNWVASLFLDFILLLHGRERVKNLNLNKFIII